MGQARPLGQVNSGLGANAPTSLTDTQCPHCPQRLSFPTPPKHGLNEFRLTSTLLRQSRGRHPSQSERALVCACVPPWVSDGGREAEVAVVVALRVARGAAAAEAATAALRWWRRTSPWPLGLSARLPASPEPAGARAGQRLPYECVTGCYPTGARRTLARSRRLRLLRRG